MFANAEEARDGLVALGYTEIRESQQFRDRWLRPGMRVHHLGEQWPEAFAKGTGTIRYIMDRSGDNSVNIEVVVERDRMDGSATNRPVAQWSGWATVPAREQPEQGS